MAETQGKPSRRGFIWGTAITGAAAATVAVLPQVQQEAAPVAVAPPKPERGGGYHESAHVQQYYKTTRI